MNKYNSDIIIATYYKWLLKYSFLMVMHKAAHFIHHSVFWKLILKNDFKSSSLTLQNLTRPSIFN